MEDGFQKLPNMFVQARHSCVSEQVSSSLLYDWSVFMTTSDDERTQQRGLLELGRFKDRDALFGLNGTVGEEQTGATTKEGA